MISPSAPSIGVPASWVGVGVVWASLAGCAGPSPCDRGGPEILATRGSDVLTCADAGVVPEWTRRVAGRRASAVDRRRMLDALAGEFATDPAVTRARLAAAGAFVDGLASLGGVSAAERRATEGYAVVAGDSAVTRGLPELGTVAAATMSVWAKDPGERLVLTEADIEGWMRFASLCREQQGAPPLRISVADRVTVYNAAIAAFGRAARAGKIGLVALGGVWPALEDAWPSVSYEQQQRWTLAAPLPPPMSSTSLAYVEALAETDPGGMAVALFQGVGDLPQQPAD